MTKTKTPKSLLAFIEKAWIEPMGTLIHTRVLDGGRALKASLTHDPSKVVEDGKVDLAHMSVSNRSGPR